MSLASKYEILQKQRFWPNYGTGTLFSGVGQKNVTYNQPIGVRLIFSAISPWACHLFIIYYRLARQKRLFLPPCQFTNPWVICVFDRLYLHYECMCVGEA